MRLFFTAWQFLTIVPTPVALRWHEGDMGRSMRYFPLVGVAIGSLLALIDRCLAAILPADLVSLLLVVVLTLVTGALHLDGLADLCDGFGARGGRERFLAVMKDSSTGAVGVTGVALDLLLKYQAIAHLPPQLRWQTLVFFPALARYAQVLLTTGSRRARADGLGALFITDTGRRELGVAAAVTLVAGWFLLEHLAVICAIIVSAFVWLARIYFHRRLGGISGDIIGAVSELSEILCLLAVVAATGVIT